MQRVLGRVELRCEECNELFPNETKLKEHFHPINTLSEGTFLILIPPSLPVGSWQAARAFAGYLDELGKRYPEKTLSFSAYEYRPTSSSNPSDMAVTALLVRVE